LAIGNGAVGVTVIEPEFVQPKLLLPATLRVTGQAEAVVNAIYGEICPEVNEPLESVQVYVVGTYLNKVPTPFAPSFSVTP
jgi:hypothetical protein